MRVQGVDVFVRDEGQGEPVLFLHGNPDSADVWDEIVPRLRRRYRCIAIDLPGFARSRAPADFDVAVENLGRFVEGVVRGLGIGEPIHLVAHDFGGAYASAFACTRPEMIRRMVVIDHTFYLAESRWHLLGRIWRTPVLGELSMLTLNWPAFYGSMKVGSRKLTTERIRHAYAQYSADTKRMVLRLYRSIGPREFAAWEARTLAAVAKIPTLVLWGRHDPYAPARMAERFGASRVVCLEESGHWVPLEVPEAAAAELLRFLGS